MFDIFRRLANLWEISGMYDDKEENARRFRGKNKKKKSKSLAKIVFPPRDLMYEDIRQE